MNDLQKRSWAEISLENIRHNYNAIRASLPEGCRFLGVVKADAYGHGAVPIAKELEKARNGLRITEGKLSNEKFVAHAPEAVVNAEREKVTKYQELIAKLEASAKSLEG